MQASRGMAILVSTALLAACAEQGGPLTREGIGTAAGAVAGGVVGSTIGAGTGKTLAVVGGALLGGLLGNVAGRSMDQESITTYDRASQQSLETGLPQTWQSPQGYQGTITPTRQFTGATGYPCREYTQTIYVDGQRYDGDGIACRDPDGIWRIMAQ